MTADSILPLSPEKREELCEKLWLQPWVQRMPDFGFDEILELSDETLLQYLHMTPQGTNANAKKPGRPRKPKTNPPRMIAESYIEVDGRLKRRQVWRDHTGREDITIAPCGDQVWWQGRRKASQLVVHWLRTGEMLDRLPREKAGKRFRAVARINGRVKHIGYYATAEERDTALALAKMGILGN
jgi:hypothetical protein